QGAGAPAAQSAGYISGAGPPARARAAVHSTDAAPRRRDLLAASSRARRPARPRARGIERRSPRLDLAHRATALFRGLARVSPPSGAVSRKAPRQGPGPLLRMRPAGFSVRMAPRSVGRRAPQPKRELARLLRR